MSQSTQKMFYCKVCSKNLPATSFTTRYFRKIGQKCSEHRKYKKCAGECNKWLSPSAFSKLQVGDKRKRCWECAANAMALNSFYKKKIGNELQPTSPSPLSPVKSISIMSLIPDLLMEIVIDYLGRHVAGEHRAVAKHWTLQPRPLNFVAFSRSWRDDFIAESIDKVRLEKFRCIGGRPFTQVAKRCELCLRAPDEGGKRSLHDINITTIVTFTKACRIPSYRSRRGIKLHTCRTLVRLNLCFLCSIIYRNKDHENDEETTGYNFDEWCDTMTGLRGFSRLEWTAGPEWACLCAENYYDD